MNLRNNRNAFVSFLFVVVGVTSLVRAEYWMAIASVAVAVAFVFLAPPRTRNRTIVGNVFVGIAVVSLVVWLIVLSGYPVRIF